MKYLFPVLFTLVCHPSFSKADNFREEASQLANDLKAALMKEVTAKVSSKGASEAISFCHMNVAPIAKKAAGERITKYKFGRTSHKVRNQKNAPEEWMKPYIKKYKKSKQGKDSTAVIHKFSDGKRAYIEPLYMQPVCLNCHGTNVSQSVKDKIKELYPADQATGFRLGEFRGLLWIKEP